MRRSMIAAAVLAIGAVTVPAAAYAAGQPANWKAQTCKAAAAYGKHPAMAGLAKVVTDATHLPKSWLAADVGQLFADAMSPGKKAVPFVRDDLKFIASDCQR